MRSRIRAAFMPGIKEVVVLGFSFKPHRYSSHVFDNSLNVSFFRHFSKSKNRRDVEGPWSPGVQAVPPSHGPLASQAPPHNLPPNGRAARPLVRDPMCPDCAVERVKRTKGRERESQREKVGGGGRKRGSGRREDGKKNKQRTEGEERILKRASERRSPMGRTASRQVASASKLLLMNY